MPDDKQIPGSAGKDLQPAGGANPMHTPLLSKDADGNLQSEQDILTAIENYRSMSYTARWTRISRNKENWNFFHGRQDWSHKMKHQSKDFMPDYPMAVERIAASFAAPFAETAEWFDIQPIGLGAAAFDPVDIRKWLQFYLNRLYMPGDYVDNLRNFALVMNDAAKMAIHEAVATFKVYAVLADRMQFLLESGNPTETTADAATDYSSGSVQVRQVNVPTLRLAIDLIPWEDFYPDPSGQNVFDIHEKSVTLEHLRANPDYDPAVIDEIANTRNQGTIGGTQPEYEKRRRNDQDYPTTVIFANLPRVRETWGDIVDMRTGKLLLRNSLVTTSVTRRFLRPPTPNPFWHGRRPFVSCPLLRVPLSVVHKAIADHAVPVVRAQNELDNLMLDGAIASVWGIRQVKPGMLENPEEIADGIPQGYTAVLKDGATPTEKFLERVDSGEMPQFAVEMVQEKKGQFQIATALPDTAQGVLPQKDVKATEVNATSAASVGLFGSISSFFERGAVCPILELSWMTLWQYVDDFLEPEVVQIIGEERALILQAMPAAERFVMMAQAIRFDVKGLRQLADSAQLFGRLTTFLQSLGTNPALLMAFDSKYDVVKYMDDMMRAIRLDPSKYEKPPAMQGPPGQGVPPVAPPAQAGAITKPGAEGPATAPGGPTKATPTAPGTKPGTSGTGKLGSEIEGTMTAANPDGFRGSQTE